MRLAVEDLDVIDMGGEIVCTHIIAKERIVVPEAAALVLRPYLGGESFSEADLATRIGPTAAQALLTNLLEARMVKTL